MIRELRLGWGLGIAQAKVFKEHGISWRSFEDRFSSAAAGTVQRCRSTVPALLGTRGVRRVLTGPDRGQVQPMETPKLA